MRKIANISNFPFVFPPYELDGNYYLDGGIVENFPMYTAQLTEKRCFGLYNSCPVKPYSIQTNYIELFLRLISVFMASSADNIQCKEGSYILKLSYEPSFFNFMSTNYDLIKIYCNDFKCNVIIIIEDENLGYWGHGIRNKHTNLKTSNNKLLECKNLNILFEHIKKVSNTKIQLTLDRKKDINNILALGYDIEQLKEAYINFCTNSFVMQNGLQLKLSYFKRDIEQFMFAKQMPKSQTTQEQLFDLSKKVYEGTL